MKDDKLYLIHITECIERIERFVSAGRDAFMASDLIQGAVLRNLQTMAESTQRLSDSLKAAHPEVSWKDIAGFRNILVHNYLDTDLDLVWKIVRQELPILKQHVSLMLQS